MNILIKTREAIFSVTTLIINAFKKIRKQNTLLAVILSQIYLGFLSCCIVYIIFKMQEKYEVGTIPLMFENFGVVFASCVLVFILCEIFYLLSFVLYVPLVIIFPVTIAAAIINTFKMEFRSEPVVFSDLLLLRETFNIAADYPMDFTKYLRLPITVFIILLILPLFIRRVRLNLIKRGAFILAAAAVIVVSFYTLVVPGQTFIENNMYSARWNIAEEYYHNGFLVGFFTSYKRSLIFAPKDYNEDTAKQYAAELGYGQDGEQPLNMSESELPNVIVIMSESYWDSENFTGARLNRDPMESVRELRRKSGGASILSSQGGGGTANVEYEFLTGKSTMFYPESSVVYQQYIMQENQWSLAWYFRDLGYVTTAIHPYHDWFWRRNIVYPLLGFESFYYNANMAYIDVEGQYISDWALITDIKHKYEKFSDGGKKPIFTFAVSMQNHGPYYDSRDPARDIVLATPRDEATDDMVEVFFEGVRYASEALVDLISYFENVERPTYIIMFGDHSPLPIAEYKQYYALNEEFELYHSDYFNRYRTPLIVWTNNKSGKGKSMEEIALTMPENITPYMLTDELFNMTALPKPKYIQMLSSIRNYTQGVTTRFMLDKHGNELYGEETDEVAEIREIMRKLEICQYDATRGKKYAIDEFAD